MDLASLHEHMAQLSHYITQSQQRQQINLPVDEDLLREAELILGRLSMIATIPATPPAKDHN